MTDPYPDISPTGAPPRPGRAPTGRPSAQAPTAGTESASIGQLVTQVSREVSTLLHQEIELAKAEVHEEATKAGRSIGMFAGAGGAGYFAVLFALLAVMFGLAEVIAIALAASIVMVLLLLVAAVLGLRGRSTARSLHPAPTRTVQTLKEDVEWARRRTR